MKDLLSKEHYYYKIHTVLMKSSSYLLFYGQPPCMGYTPSFLQENLDPPPSLIFEKSQPPINKGVHTLLHMIP